jgi:signal peptidase I
VIALVFFLRSFLFEPFKIPSSSMVPTLLVGDLILVNKFDYGIRLPVINKKIIEVGNPQRGDVMVFKYPKDMSQDYIKRVIGVPGDKITYENKRLTVNGQAGPVRADGRLPRRRASGVPQAVPGKAGECAAPHPEHGRRSARSTWQRSIRISRITKIAPIPTINLPVSYRRAIIS